jgi:hypothetical protein
MSPAEVTIVNESEPACHMSPASRVAAMSVASATRQGSSESEAK